ncbi:hypothetical protein D3C80_1627750 [compost metagenome]
MGFEADQTINNVAAGLLELACPGDVPLFVKPGFQLDNNCDLFAGFSGIGESSDQRRVAAYPVECHFDRHDMLILGGLGDEVGHCIKGFVWMIDEHIAFTEYLEEVLILLEFRRILRFNRSIEQIIEPF